MIKQHDFDQSVFVILNGAVEVVREHKELSYDEYRDIVNCVAPLQKATAESQKIMKEF